MRVLTALLFSILAVTCALAQTGSPKTPSQLNAEVNSLWPDNTTGQITPHNARQTLLDLIASGAGGIVIGQPITGVCSTGYVIYKDSGGNAGCQAAGTGGGSSLVMISSGTAIPGAAVYISGANSFSLARANAFSTGGVIGLAADAIAGSGPITTAGALALTTAQWDAVTGGSGGLTTGALYFLDPGTAGHLTTLAPSAPGQVVTVIGRAISSSTIQLNIGPPTQL